MAQKLSVRQEKRFVEKIGFKEVQLFQDQILGIGAYGKVCRAKCDGLICAAKILHHTLFDPVTVAEQDKLAPQKEHRLPMNRFQQECEIMSAISHPNIVQFLGITLEPTSKVPVILMELMEESLTHFLKNSQGQQSLIPYHTQVNICLDIALAMAYLHSNKIIHRDLSSNNILLLLGGSIRAKVSDLGMARLSELNAGSMRHQRSFTVCPGTQVYMPPEAVQDKPIYTEKIDCFSFGVLTIQILTRQSPKPVERLRHVDMSLIPGVPRDKLMISLSEIERRENHISMVEKDHPLLSVSLECLQDKEVDRPTAKQICQRVSSLKESAKYRESSKGAKERTSSDLKEKDDEMNALKLKYKQELDNFQQIIRSLEARLDEVHQHVEKQENTIHKKERVIEEQKLTIYQKEQIISKVNEQNKQELSSKEGEIQALKLQLKHASVQQTQMVQVGELSETNQKLTAEVGDLKRTLQVNQYIMAQKEANIKKQHSALLSKEGSIQQLTRQLEQTRTQLGTEIQAKTDVEKKLEQCEEFLAKFQERNTSLEQQLERQNDSRPPQQPQNPQKTQNLLTAGSLLEMRMTDKQFNGNPTQSAAVLVGNVQGPIRTTDLRLRWRKGNLAPKKMHRGANPIIHENIVYFAPSTSLGSGPILCYNIPTRSWFEIFDYPYCTNRFSLAIVKNLLTGIGGYCGNGFTNQLLSLKIEGGNLRWMEIFPPMPTKRAHASVLVSGVHLIVIGGRDENGPLATTEVMNTETLHWSTSQLLLPEPITNASVTVFGDRVYLLAGDTGIFYISNKSVYSCLLSALLQSTATSRMLGRPGFSSAPNRADSQWTKMADLPVFHSTCISFRGSLLAIGGEDSEKKSTSAIHVYNPSTRSWNLTNHLMTARTCCFVAVLPNDELMVVGGWTKRVLLLLVKESTNEVEFGTVV